MAVFSRLKTVVASCGFACLALLSGYGSSAFAAQPANQAVVLVSGLNSPTPFTTPDPSCAGKEGDVWGTLIAPQLKQQGFNVYTAPASKGGQTFTPCGGSPPPSAYIDATQGIDQNGQALASFLAYLNQTFGVTDVQIVAHSYGGLWSRSAFSQNSPYSASLRIDSLTTLGSPQTGSFAADLAQFMVGASCDKVPTRIARLACELFQNLVERDVQYLGPEAVEELTSTYIGAWNPSQEIGSCPVTPIAGTFVDLGQTIDNLLGSYYLPNDGLVGLGSAAYTTAPKPYSPPSIPGLQPVASFDVVHGSALSFLSQNNLLNQQAIVDRIVQALNQGSTANCVKNPLPPPPPPPTPPPAPPSNNTVAPTQIVAPSGGTLPKPRRGDVILVSAHSKVRCGRRLIDSRPLVRSRQYEVIVQPRCPRRLKVSGGRATLLRHAKGKQVRVREDGGEVQITVRGRGQHERIRAEAQDGKKWKRLHLSRSGKAKLPTGDSSVPVRVTILGPGGSHSVAVFIVRTAA